MGLGALKHVLKKAREYATRWRSVLHPRTANYSIKHDKQSMP
ncbi:hypothetical protein [Bartonella harrusi]